ncbi:MAG: hypothetical protein E7190_12265 [Erysipelotrichaceae bacterium]|nr:hypothetical protein [Erysipelotrichaceae bacterium]
MAKIAEHFRKYRFYYLASLIGTCLVLLPYFDSVIYRGHDLQFHLSRIDGNFTCFQDHQFPIAIYPEKNFGYGYSAPLFYSDLFLIIPSALVHIFHIPLVVMFKITVFIFCYLTNLGMMLVSDSFFHRKDASVLSAFLLTSCNYYMTDVYIRGALGEIIAFSLLPPLAYIGYRFLYLEEDHWLALGIIFALIAHCHLISVVLAAAVFGILMILNIRTFLRNKKMIISFLKAFAIGLGMTIGYFLPLLEQYVSQDLKVHHIDPTMLETYRVPIQMIWQDFFSEFSLTWATEEGINAADKAKAFGTLLTILPLGYLFAEKKKPLTHCMILWGILVLASSDVIPLYKLTFLNFLQYPSRLYMPASIFAVILIAYIYVHLNRNAGKVLAAVCVLFTAFNLSFPFTTLNDKEHVMDIPNNASAWDLFGDRLWAFDHWLFIEWNWEEVAYGEYLPFAYGYNYHETGTHIDLLDYTHTEFPYERTGTTSVFTADLNEDTWLLVPVTWYKGYRAWETDDEGNIIAPVYISQHEYSGRIQLNVPAGHHSYLIRYTGTKIQKGSAVLSILSFLYVLYLLAIRKHAL